MNKVILLGNIVRDPEVKSYSNTSFTVFTLAVSDGYGDKKKTYFVNCLASGKTGENIAKFFSKGKQILVEGKLYTKKNDKTNYDELRVSVFAFHFVGPADTNTTAKKKESKKEGDTFDEIPF